MDTIKSVIIAKNRDFLIGYLTGCIDTKNQYNIVPIQEDTQSNDVIEDKLPTLSHDSIFDVHCSCGNYIAFKKWEDIPNIHLPCGLCDGYFIFYTDLGGLNENEKNKENKG